MLWKYNILNQVFCCILKMADTKDKSKVRHQYKGNNSHEPADLAGVESLGKNRCLLQKIV